MKKLEPLLLVLVLAAALPSWWVFSRFTVDDAFITWRYGKNLVEAGAWNYSPSAFEPTQAYTNPVFALASVVPAALGLDVVLFFKLVGLGLALAFARWFGRASGGAWLGTLAFFALPAAVMHLFAGLETFAFVAVLSALFVALLREDARAAVLLTSVAFFTRPEAWPLVALVPLYFLFEPPEWQGREILKAPWLYLKNLGRRWDRVLLLFALLAVPLGALLLTHHLLFGSALPNTFYVKASQPFSLDTFLRHGLFVLPVILVAALGHGRLALVMGLLFGAMVVSAATSQLLMDYAGRFAFHVFGPTYFVLVYLGRKAVGTLQVNERIVPRRWLASIAAALLLAEFAAQTANHVGVYLGTYYPRLLRSHGGLGEVLARAGREAGVRVVALGDAGLTAYRGGLDTIDLLGLGSAQVARQGLSAALLDRLKPDVVVLYAGPDGVKRQEKGHEVALAWAEANGLEPRGDVWWRADYALRVFSRAPLPGLDALCERTAARNRAADDALADDAWRTPPWRWWTAREP